MTLHQAIMREVNDLIMSGDWLDLSTGEVATRIEAAVVANQAMGDPAKEKPFTGLTTAIGDSDG